MKTKEEQIEGKNITLYRWQIPFLNDNFCFLYNSYLNVFAALHVFG